MAAMVLHQRRKPEMETMQVKLNQKEVNEALIEWAQKRGLDFNGKSITVGISNGVAYVYVEGVEVPPQFGPYR